MSKNKMTYILNIISLITTIALIIVINTHTDLSHLFYLFGNSATNAESSVDGQFNTFFISSLGITSFIIIATYLLIARCITILAKVLIIIADIALIAMASLLTQERVLHNFISDTHISEAIATSPESSSIIMGTSDTTLLTTVLVYMVIMLIGVIRTYKSHNGSMPNKASAYD